MEPVTTESVLTALHLKLPRELGIEKVQIGEGQGKSGNWESLTPGSSEEKLLHLMGWDPGKAQAALSSVNKAEQLCWDTGAVWCLSLSVPRKPGTENPAGKCIGKEMSAEQVKEKGKPPHSVSVVSPQEGLTFYSDHQLIPNTNTAICNELQASMPELNVTTQK